MAYLLGRTALTALVGTRIQFDEEPQGSALPAIVILDVSDVKHRDLLGQTKLEQPTRQFSVLAYTKSAAKAVARQLKAALSDYHGTLSGVVVQRMALITEHGGRQSVAEGQPPLHRIDLEYEITYLKEE